MKRPARQTVKVRSSSSQLVVAPGGDVYIAAQSWTGLQVHRWATGKTDTFDAAAVPAHQHLAFAGDRRLVAGSFDFDRQRDLAIVVDLATMAVVKLDTKAKLDSINSLVATADHVALAFGHLNAKTSGIALFTTAGKHVRTIELDRTANGMMFAPDGKSLLFVDDTALSRIALDGKRATPLGTKLAYADRETRLTRRGPHVLAQTPGHGGQHIAYVIVEASGKRVLELPDSEVASWGPADGTLVMATGADVTIVDLAGNKVGGFRRDRTTRLDCAVAHPDGFWLGAGSFLEIYDFGQLAAVKKSVRPPGRAAPKPPEILPAAKAADDLLRAIWADPTDKAALQVYADWLAEQGSTRGEYIQLCLAGDDDRAYKLLRKHRGEWLGAARKLVRSWSDSSQPPGFVSRVWCEADKLIAGFAAIAALGPRMEISVTSMRTRKRQTEAALAKLPLGSIAYLDLSANGLDDTGLATLAPAMTGLYALDVSGNPVTGAGLAAVGAHVDTLRYLCVRPQVALRGPERTAAADGLARAILDTPGFGRLAHVHFRGDPPSAAVAKELRRKFAKVNVDSYVHDPLSVRD